MKKLIGSIWLTLIFSTATFAQDFITVSGTIIDDEAKLPMAGCHVYLNKELGTVSNQYGEFNFKIPVGLEYMKLNFSFIGYETLQKSIANLGFESLNISMNPSPILLDEVQVISDPWTDFRQVITELSSRYEDKDQFKKAILEEFRRMDLELSTEVEKRRAGR